MARKPSKENLCKLPEFEITPVLSSQEASQIVDWYISKFKIDEMWKISTGEGIKVAVLDTPVQLDHPDIKDNIIGNYNFCDPKKSANAKKAKHGTHVCGIICAQNNDIGTLGIAYNSKLLVGAVLDENGVGKFNNVSQGVRWAIENKADIISMSLGSPSPIQEVRKAIQLAKAKNIPVFCAGGNAGSNSNLFYPSAYPESISVAAVDSDLRRAKFSNVGKNLDFMAPGVKILSTTPYNDVSCMNGSSQAAPFFAGIAALVLSYIKNNKTKLNINTVDDLRALLKKSCTPIQEKGYQGAGIFSVDKFLNLIK